MDDVGHVLDLRARAAAAAAARQRGRDAVHAPEAHHFLVQVDLALQVRAERRCRHGQHVGVVGIGHLAAQAAEDVDDLLARDLGAHHGAEARHAELQVDRLGLLQPHVHHAGAHRAARHLGDERGGHVGVEGHRVVVHPALVAHGRLADQAQVAARAAGVRAIERGGLQQHRGGSLGDLGLEAAHDAGQRHGALGRGDDGHVGHELAVFAVERGEPLALGRRAHHDVRLAVRACQLVEVERVQRLAQQEQDVVRHVHDVVDGAGARGGHALGQPVGARAHLHALDDARRVAAAAGRVGDFHAHLVGRRGRVGVLHEVDLRALHVGAVHRAHLARHARHAEAVGAVRRDLEVEHRVGQLEVVGDGHAHRRVLGQDPDALVVAAHTQLALRAAHAAASDAAQLGLLDLEVAGQHRADGGHRHLDPLRDVRRAAHDLHRLARAHVHGDHVHVVAVGMLLARLHVAHDHAVERVARLLDRLHARARQIKPVAERLHVRRHVHILRQPFQRNLHQLFLFPPSPRLTEYRNSDPS